MPYFQTDWYLALDVNKTHVRAEHGRWSVENDGWEYPFHIKVPRCDLLAAITIAVLVMFFPGPLPILAAQVQVWAWTMNLGKSDEFS